MDTAASTQTVESVKGRGEEGVEGENKEKNAAVRRSGKDSGGIPKSRARKRKARPLAQPLKGSGSYAEMLSEYKNKGHCGAKEIFESTEAVEQKVKMLAKYIRDSKHVVVYTGAGISTAAGIPDFRGPKGIWTCEKKGVAPPVGAAWDETKPTFTHFAINLLYKKKYVHALISQNVDGLHLRSGFPRDRLSELHGNMFMEKCERCQYEYLRSNPINSVGLKLTGSRCTQTRTATGRPVGCRGRLRDTTLDWEDVLPEPDFSRANEHSQKATLAITLGTSLQINPAGLMPLESLKNPDGKLVIVNLQTTPHDKKATLVIHTYVDRVMKGLLKELGLSTKEATEER